ncbi:MAG: prefoldin subunit alpha [Nitrososphaerota archaeon]|jgi:prefoldin alpha subunit|nr:prefoldin subunit alpha [Nitrososphaerota archaeon]MDG6923791.1 prefoldin subunit alpha [Nitrososphaerota archaeon]
MSKPSQKPQAQASQEQVEQQLNQLVSEIRILESYYNEVVSKIQTASSALSDVRATIQSIDGLAKNPNNDFLIPIGAGLLLPTSNLETKKLVLSVGAGVAIEKDLDSSKAFLQAREKEYSSALNTLDQQRKEIGSRLEAGRNILQQITGQG